MFSGKPVDSVGSKVWWTLCDAIGIELGMITLETRLLGAITESDQSRMNVSPTFQWPPRCGCLRQSRPSRDSKCRLQSRVSRCTPRGRGVRVSAEGDVAAQPMTASESSLGLGNTNAYTQRRCCHFQDSKKISRVNPRALLQTIPDDFVGF